MAQTSQSKRRVKLKDKFQWFPVTPVAEGQISARRFFFFFSPKIIVVWPGPGGRENASRIMIENEPLFLIKNNKDSSFVIIVEVAVARSPLGRARYGAKGLRLALWHQYAARARGNTRKQTSVIERCHFVAYSFVFFSRVARYYPRPRAGTTHCH